MFAGLYRDKEIKSGFCSLDPAEFPLLQPSLQSLQISLVISQSVQSLSRVQKFVTSWTTAMDYARLPVHHQLPELTQTHVHRVGDTIQPSYPLSPTFPPSINIFSNESVLRIRWPKYWSFSFSISPSNEYSGLISFRIDWFDLLAVVGTLKSLLQHHSSKHQFFGAQLCLWSSSYIHT